MTHRLKDLILGDPRRVAGAVYGTIIVMSVLAAGARAYERHLWKLVVIGAVTVLVLWLAHVYAHGLSESLRIGRGVTIAELWSIARREASILAAAIPPLIATGLGAAGVLSERTGVLLGLWLGVAALTAQGLRYAQLEHLSPRAGALAVGLNLGIGLGLVALEVWIAH